ncbi:exonuclease sbcCD subunit D [Salipaludibacillus neizhouensis]|uniref:Nuclease SbcCD subunit D n=1 Tax=Salipaludibacillus neizhouensis TaxID=885475 RepID=A0A3A9KA10_9BACI|nr:exonuclease SbcCD subunit D [Salipaludibacillus neizhouensis]RKL69347.1 exonuclease sbcCD subunit D [Salipaludibacillus neizhouensis]
MRLLHTADWHIGRTIEGRDRLEEHEDFFEELVEICNEENIDAVLMAGDVFDSVNPPAKGEELFYESMARLSDYGKRPVIIISGNHDHPERLAAARTVLKKHRIYIQGYPTMEPLRISIDGCKEPLAVAGLPYPSESRLKESFTESNDELQLREAYDEKVTDIFNILTESFTDKEIRIAMSHLFVAGGSSTESERPIEVGGAYTVRATQLPANVQYTALGHLHRPQDIKNAPARARYSGSPLAFSFSEAGYAKSVSVVDIKAGKVADVKDVYLRSGRPLVRWKATEGLAQVHSWIDEKKDNLAWIELDIHVDDTPSMNEIHKIKKAYPHLLTIRPIFPENQSETLPERKHVAIDELFNQFYQRQTGGATPDQELTRLFLDIVNEEEEGGSS